MHEHVRATPDCDEAVTLVAAEPLHSALRRLDLVGCGCGARRGDGGRRLPYCCGQPVTEHGGGGNRAPAVRRLELPPPGRGAMRMVMGPLAMARPIAASDPDRRVPLIRQGTGPGGWVIVGKQDSCPPAPSASDLHPHLRVRPQVADVISLRAVCGHHPEGVIYHAVPDWGVPVAASAAAGGFQQRESPRCETMQQQESPQPVAGSGFSGWVERRRESNPHDQLGRCTAPSGHGS